MADGSRHSLAYILEAVYGTTPANPIFKALRHVGTSLGLSRDQLMSEELRGDRMIPDVRGGAHQVGGDVGFELSYGSLDDLLEATLCGTWATSRTTTAISMAVGIGPVTFTRTVGSFLTDGFAVGHAVLASGFTNGGNNGRWRITVATALVLTVTPLAAQTAVVETAAAGRTIVSDSQLLRAGLTRRSFTLERNFADIAPADKPFHRSVGVELNSMELSVNANQMITGSFGVIGSGMALATAILAGATYPAAPVTSVLDSFTGALLEGGATLAIITELQLTLANGLEPRWVVGSKSTLRPSIARSNVSGTISAYFDNATMLDKFINETTSSISITLPDAAGNKYTVTLPRIKYTGGQPDVSGEGPILLSMPWQAILDPVSGTNFHIEREAA